MKHTFRRAVPHYSDQQFDGRQRVVIENVSPELDGGKYLAKAVEGERIVVEADIFVDGADTISAELCFRPAGRAEWQRSPMTSQGNDRWQGFFTVGVPGIYDYTIEAWVDHFQTWKKGLSKKIGAGQEVSLDLQIGALFVSDGAARAGKDDAAKLTEYAALLRSEEKHEAAAAALDGNLEQLMGRNPDKAYSAVYEKVLGLTVEQKKAGCSSWYELFPRSWSTKPGKHGTFNDCIRLLPLIAGMGFDVVYLPPIHPIGYTKRKGKNNALVAAPDDPGSCWAIGNKEEGKKKKGKETSITKCDKKLSYMISHSCRASQGNHHPRAHFFPLILLLWRFL